MIRSILAVIAGIVLWSVLWLGYNALLTTIGLLPADSASPVQAPTPLLFLLVGSVFFSLASGYVTTALAPSAGRNAAIVLGVLLLAIGVLVQAQLWQLLPLWYNLLFLLLLLPITVLGGEMRKNQQAKR